MFLHRLRLRSVLGPAEQEAVLSLPTTMVEVPANRDFVQQGKLVRHASLVADGLTARYAETASGERQLVEFHIPGDMADLHSVVAPNAISGLQALTRSTILNVPHKALREAASRLPILAQAFWRDGIVDAGVISQTAVNLGRRDALSRVAHLFCEMAIRYRQIGRETDGVFAFPATQTHIADALGLTPVHVSRVLTRLRKGGLLDFDRGEARIDDWDGLASAAEFDPEYLQLTPVAFD